jgi:hypothetical protein
MAQFQAFDPNVEVSEVSAKAFVEAMDLFKNMALQILAKHGIPEPTGQGWIAQQPYLDAYREIYERIGTKTLKQIGKRVPETAVWPPEIITIEDALASIDAAYQMNHRGGEIGYYRFTKTGERSGEMLCYNPYPCPFDEGIIDTIARKFASQANRVRVEHGKDFCRQKGADTCTYRIFW